MVMSATTVFAVVFLLTTVSVGTFVHRGDIGSTVPLQSMQLLVEGIYAIALLRDSRALSTMPRRREISVHVPAAAMASVCSTLRHGLRAFPALIY